MATLFGWKFEEKKTQDEDAQPQMQAFAPPEIDDGATYVNAAGMFGTYLPTEGSFQSEYDLIARYRSMVMHPECELAVDEIVNESIVSGRKNSSVSIDLDYVEDISEMLKERIRDEFTTLLEKLDFKYHGYEIFRRWFVDGRLYYHVMIDNENPQKGIQELRTIDPFKIKKIREKKMNFGEEDKVQLGNQELLINQQFYEYYIYSETGISTTQEANNTGTTSSSQQKDTLKIAPDTIVYANSGLLDERRVNVISYLHKAFRALNQVRMLEDASIIYRLSRAPSRRVFYVDVGNLPKAKAEQYMYSLMNQYRNKMVYDPKSGSMRDDRKFQSMLEDYWMPRRNGSATTEIDTLVGNEQSFTQLDELEYFQRQLFRSLNVPISRMQPESGFSLGRASEISREEYKFLRFIERLRNRFSSLFMELLRRQLVLKNIMSLKQWEDIQEKIHFTFDQDSNFNALKGLELLTEKMNVLREAEEYRGKYFSANYIRKNILSMTDEEIEKIDEEIEEEKNDMKYAPQEGDMMSGGMGMGGGLGGGLGGDLGGLDSGLGGDLGGGLGGPPTGGMTNDLGGDTGGPGGAPPSDLEGGL